MPNFFRYETEDASLAGSQERPMTEAMCYSN